MSCNIIPRKSFTNQMTRCRLVCSSTRALYHPKSSRGGQVHCCKYGLTMKNGSFMWYCWWKKSCTSWYVIYPISYRVLTILGGVGFLTSTVSSFFFHFGWGYVSFEESILIKRPGVIPISWVNGHMVCGGKAAFQLGFGSEPPFDASEIRKLKLVDIWRVFCQFWPGFCLKNTYLPGD